MNDLCFFCMAGAQARLLAALRAHGPAAAEKLESLTGLSVSEIHHHTSQMQREGLIEPVVAGGIPLAAGGSQVWRAAN